MLFAFLRDTTVLFAFLRDTTMLWKLAGGCHPARIAHFILLRFLINNLLHLFIQLSYLSHVLRVTFLSAASQTLMYFYAIF